MTVGAVEDSFEHLMERHRGILYKVSRLYCARQESRDDLVQEILIQLWRSFERWDRSRPFSTWMYRIALNVAISFHRKESAHAKHVLEGEEHLLQLPSQQREEPETIRVLYRYIESLEPLDRALILLHLDGCSYEETADVLGITVTNVATKLSRLKARMKLELGERTEG